MHAHTPPFTKPAGAYDARKLYDETTQRATEHDAAHPISDIEAKVRTALSYLHHAQLLLKEAFPYTSNKRVEKTPESVHGELAETVGIETLARHVPHWHKDWGKGVPAKMRVYLDAVMDELVIPAESSYLASFSPNGSRIATAAEIDSLRDLLTAVRDWRCSPIAPRHAR
jgi:hypothetical protein